METPAGPVLAKEGRSQGPSLTGSQTMPWGLGDNLKEGVSGPCEQFGCLYEAGGPHEPGAPRSWMFTCLPAPLSSHMFWVGAQFKHVGSLPHTFLFPGVILTPWGLS